MRVPENCADAQKIVRAFLEIMSILGNSARLQIIFALIPVYCARVAENCALGTENCDCSWKLCDRSRKLCSISLNFWEQSKKLA
jgi:hypothetical protein